MERDEESTPSFEELVPPPDRAKVGTLSLIGVGMVAVAAVMGLVGPEWMSTVRLWLVGLGAVAVGYAVSLKPGMPQLWLLASAAYFLAGGFPIPLPRIGLVGVPDSWDSAQFMFRVLAGVALVGAGMAALAYTWRLRVASALIVLHFFGIFLATTSPSTQGSGPYWITEQLFNKVFMHYQQFVYLRNAYHFYSPEPGPASLVVFLLKTKVGTEVVNGETRDKFERRWVVMPSRPKDIKDPLGVSYFRRLSLTEQVAAPGNVAASLEPSRYTATYEEERGPGRTMQVVIPLAPMGPGEVPSSQYRMPSPITYRYLLPSYATHVIQDQMPDAEAMKNTTVMIYHLVHRTMNVEEARMNVAPFAPSTYRTYYLGEYDFFGKLQNPRDPMLYWLVPVFSKQPGLPTSDNPELFEDYLSRHAGLKFDWSSLR